MTTIPSDEMTVFSPKLDTLSYDHNWTRDKTTRVGKLEHRHYYYSHSCAWQAGQIIWAAIQTIFSLGLALISNYTWRTWQQGCSGKEWNIVHIHHKDETPTPTPQKPQKPVPGLNKPVKPVKPIATPDSKPITTPTSSQKLKQPAKIQHTGVVVDPNQLDLSSFSKADAKLFKDIEKMFPIINSIEESVGKKDVDQTAAKIWAANAPIEELKRVYNEILKEFQQPAIRNLYGYMPHADQYLFNLKIGQKVKGYWANVTNVDESGFSVRYRSVLGLRYLAQFGAEIFDELNAKLFEAGRESYRDMEGLQKLFYNTGSTVDLEWPLGNNITEANAIKEGRKLIDAFKARFSSFGNRLNQRNLDNWEHPVPNCQGHTERGLYPVWRRNIAYFVNVPNIFAVVSALLKGPLLFAQSYLILKSKGRPIEPIFNDKSLSQGCFNAKLEQAQEFNLECLELIKPTPKSIAIAKYGQAAVDSALNCFEDMDTLFDDDKIRPPKNESVTKELLEMREMPHKQQKTAYAAWKIKNTPTHLKELKEKVDAFVAKAEKMNWKNVLFFDGKTYRPFDRSVIEEQLEAIINYEHQNFLGCSDGEVHYI